MAVAAVRAPAPAFEPEALALLDDPAPARTARRFVERRAATLGDDVVEAASLVTTELVTNAALHTPGVVELRVGRTEDGLVVSVEDCSPVPPRVQRHSLRAGTGRGIQLAAAYAARWGFEPLPQGKRVWALLTPASVAAALTAAQGLELPWASL